jgi:hypothetical protein
MKKTAGKGFPGPVAGKASTAINKKIAAAPF